MKKTTKMVLGTAAMVAISAGVAGVTTYSLMDSRQEQNTSFFSEFKNDSNYRTAALDAATLQPVDLTQAAESTLNSVVHIKSVHLPSTCWQASLII